MYGLWVPVAVSGNPSSIDCFYSASLMNQNKYPMRKNVETNDAATWNGRWKDERRRKTEIERKKERKRWVGKLKKRSKELKGRARFIYKLTPDNDRLTESRRDRFTIRNIISTFTLADRSCHSTLMRSSSSCYFVSCKDESSVAMVLCQWAIYTRKSQPATPIQYTIYLYILV